MGEICDLFLIGEVKYQLVRTSGRINGMLNINETFKQSIRFIVTGSFSAISPYCMQTVNFTNRLIDCKRSTICEKSKIFDQKVFLRDRVKH